MQSDRAKDLPARDGAHDDSKRHPMLQSISAVTLVTTDMARSVAFYRALGFTLRYGGEQEPFTSLIVGPNYLNLMAGKAGERVGTGADGEGRNGWGRVIIYVSDVDAMYEHARLQGFEPDTAPTDAPWGERYFHIDDPDGHPLSFAAPL